MKTFAWVAAALAVALTTGCKDRDRDTTDDRVEATADRAGDSVREGAHDVGEAADTAGDKVGDKLGDAARDVGNATEDAARRVTGTWTYERRDEYRQEARTRLAGLDRQLADARKSVNADASEAYTKAVAAARETRSAVGRDIPRLRLHFASVFEVCRRDRFCLRNVPLAIPPVTRR